VKEETAVPDHHGKLKAESCHRAGLANLLIDVQDEVLSMAEALGLLVFEYDGTRVGVETLRLEIADVLEVLARRQIAGEFPLVSNEAALADAAAIERGHVKVILAQPWSQLTKLLLESLRRRGQLPTAAAQRLVAYTDISTKAAEGSYRIGSAWVLTIVAHTALFPGFGELVQDFVVWTPDASSARSRRLLRMGRGPHLTNDALGALESLLDEHEAFRQILKGLRLGPSTVLPQSTPWVADAWKMGPRDNEAGMVMPDVFALGDVPRAVSTLTQRDTPAIFAALVSTRGPHSGSLGFTPDQMWWDGSQVVSRHNVAHELLSFSPRVASDFTQIDLRDEWLRGERFDVPAGVRHLTSAGGLINGGTPDAVLLRQVAGGGETIAFAHNLPIKARGFDILVQGTEALLRMRREAATSDCVTGAILELGAPYNVRGHSAAAKLGMLGLGAFFRAALVAAVREHERTEADGSPEADGPQAEV
jgi:hypothetical protein